MSLKTARIIQLLFQKLKSIGSTRIRPHAKIPNAETVTATNEMEAGGGKVYNSPDTLFDSWEKK